jgi:hypothetical protein
VAHQWHFLDEGVPEQAKAIIDVSPQSVSYILSRHYDCQKTLSRSFLSVSLNCARKFKTDVRGNTGSVFIDYVTESESETKRRLVDTLFMELDGGDAKKVSLFHRYLKIFVSARKKKVIEDKKNHR